MQKCGSHLDANDNKVTENPAILLGSSAGSRDLTATCVAAPPSMPSTAFVINDIMGSVEGEEWRTFGIIHAADEEW